MFMPIVICQEWILLGIFYFYAIEFMLIIICQKCIDTFRLLYLGTSGYPLRIARGISAPPGLFCDVTC